MKEGDFVQMVENAMASQLTDEERRIETLLGMLEGMLGEWKPRSLAGEQAKHDAHLGTLKLRAYLLVNSMRPESLDGFGKDAEEAKKLRDR